MKTRILTSTFFFLLILCGKTILARQIPEIKLPADLQIVLTNYETHWENNDAKALSMLFTEDGFILRPGYEIVKGRTKIEDSYKSSGGDLVLKAYDYQIEKNLAYILGGYTYGNRTEDMGKYTLVLKKVKDKWLIHSDMDNGNSGN